jgi:hypothetical protein
MTGRMIRIGTRPTTGRQYILTGSRESKGFRAASHQPPDNARSATHAAGRGARHRRGPRARRSAGSVPPVDPAQLANLHPTLYHMAEDGSWPSIQQRGLLSAQAIVDLYLPGDEAHARILSIVRRDKITLASATLGDITIRDQRPAKFVKVCMHDGVDPQDFLNALNGRVFFWLHLPRLKRLLNARSYRDSKHVVLHVDTARLLKAYSDRVQLAPYNTGSMHVPNAPKRGPDVFTDLADYPYEQWLAKRRKSTEPVVELTIRYAVPDISAFVTRVETWEGGKPIAVLYRG